MTQAGSVLGIGEPAASVHVRDLERILAVRLFERADGKFVPASAGVALLQPARRALAAVDDAISNTAEYRRDVERVVRIGADATICTYLLPNIILRTRELASTLSFVISIKESAELVSSLESGDLDIGIISMPTGKLRSLASYRLISDPLIAVLPAAIARAETSVSAEQLSALPLIYHKSTGRTRSLVDGWFRQAKIAPKPIMELDNAEVVKALVACGLGAAILPKMMVGQITPGTVLRSLEPSLSRELGYVIRREKQLHDGLSVFVESSKRVALELMAAG